MNRRQFAALLPALVAVRHTAADTAPAPRLAIIIDDLGYGLGIGQRVIDLPGPIACAILPRTPCAAELAKLAHRAGKEVLLHLPMQPMAGVRTAEHGVIDLETSRQEFSRIFLESLGRVPHASGVNNHQGSLLTRHPGHMQWLMEELLQRHGLFFVDSYTTHLSVAMQVAAEHGVPALRRNVFLDPDRAPETVSREFRRAVAEARTNGVAVAIGHPHPATLALLERELPGLAAARVALVPLKALIRERDVRHASSG